MKKISLCGYPLFQSVCQLFLNRRKWLQSKKRMRVLKRLEHLSVTAK